MRMSVNRLMEEELAARLVQSDALSFRSEHQHYYDLFGIAELRGAVARFLTTHFRALQSLLPENVSVVGAEPERSTYLTTYLRVPSTGLRV